MDTTLIFMDRMMIHEFTPQLMRTPTPGLVKPPALLGLYRGWERFIYGSVATGTRDGKHHVHCFLRALLTT